MRFSSLTLSLSLTYELDRIFEFDINIFVAIKSFLPQLESFSKSNRTTNNNDETQRMQLSIYTNTEL